MALNDDLQGNQSTPRDAAWSGPAALGLVLSAALAYSLAVNILAVGFPYWDDYHAVLYSLGRVRAAETVSEKAAVVFSQHNEHRPAWLRAVSLACLTVQGRVDFRTLIWLGNLGLVALAVALVAGARRSVRWPSVLALIPLALLSPIQGKQMIWAMAAVSNFWVLAFAAAALLLLSGGTRAKYSGACVLAVLATFASGQGLLCFVAGAALLAMERRWRRLLTWLALMALCAVVYFHNYVRPPHHPSPRICWTAVEFFPVMVGGALSDLACRALTPVLTNPPLEAALEPTIRAATGLALIGLAAWLWARRYYRRNPFVSVCLFYLLLVCAAVSATRGQFGLEHALVAHYKVISVCLAVLVVVGVLDEHYGRLGAPCPQAAVLYGGTLFCLLSWVLCYPGVRAFSTDLAEARTRFVQSQDTRTLPRVPWRQEGADILWHSYLTGLLPLADLEGAQGMRLSPDRLSRIATSWAQALPLPLAPEGRLIAKLRWMGDDFLLVPTSGSAEAHTTAGSLLLKRGKLYYVLPARAAEGQPIPARAS